MSFTTNNDDTKIKSKWGPNTEAKEHNPYQNSNFDRSPWQRLLFSQVQELVQWLDSAPYNQQSTRLLWFLLIWALNWTSFTSKKPNVNMVLSEQWLLKTTRDKYCQVKIQVNKRFKSNKYISLIIKHLQRKTLNDNTANFLGTTPLPLLDV